MRHALPESFDSAPVQGGLGHAAPDVADRERGRYEWAVLDVTGNALRARVTLDLPVLSITVGCVGPLSAGDADRLADALRAASAMWKEADDAIA